MSKEALQALGIEDLDKSFNDSLETLRAFLNPMEKSKKAGAVEKETPEEEEEEEEEEGAPKPAMKSLEDSIYDDDPEAGAAMDIEPFLRSMVKSLDEKFESQDKAIRVMRKGLKAIEEMNRALARHMVLATEMTKAMSDTVEKIGEQPVPSKSILRKSGNRFEEEPGTTVELSRADILDKALKLCRDGKMNELDVTKIEGRLNKNLPLEERHVALLKSIS